jgi:translation elongation factor EF-1alpha
MIQDINVAICGHAWHGKSTLVGKTCAEIGMVGRRELEKYEGLARQGRDHSLVFALLVFRQKDPTIAQDEAARGITVLPSFVRFELPGRRVTVIDTPGQENYANNRLSGLFTADCAVLVVDARDGVKQVTEQVLRVLRGYEIPLKGVAISKMDEVGYGEEGFLEAVELVKMVLKMYGIPDDGVTFIPTSAYAPGRSIFEPGEGITRFKRIDWYKGPTFYDFLKSLDFRTIRPLSPLRLVVHSADVHEQVPGIGTAVTALVESGVLRRDQTLVFEPLSSEQGEPVTAHVRSVELTKGHVATPGIPIVEAIPRQLVGVALQRITPKVSSLRDVTKGRGLVLGTEDSPPRVAREIEAEVTVFDPEVKVNLGMQWTLHAHVDKVGVEIQAISAAADRPTDRLLGGEWVRLRLGAIRPIAIEEAGVLPPLSKLVLREYNRPLGFGRCLKILR